MGGLGRRRLLGCSLVGVVLLPCTVAAQGGGIAVLPIALQAEAPVRSEPTPIGIPSLRLPEGDTTGSPRNGTNTSGRTVTSRRQSAYDPIGITLDGFRLYPSMEFRGGYDGNVFAQPDGVSDVYGVVRAQASLESLWSRHGVSLDGFVGDRFYAKSGSEDGLTYRVHGSGRLDIARQSALTLDLNRERQFLRRGATAEILTTRRPTRYQLTSAGLDYRQGFNRLRADVSAYYGHFDYENAETPDGVPIDFSFRDYDLYRGRVELGYATGAGPIFFVSVASDLRRYRVQRGPLSRDSNGVEVLGGLSGEITPLIRGRAGIGYIRTEFDDPNIGSRGRVSFDVDLDYLVTELTTVNLGARRYFSNVSATTAPSGLTTEISLGVDHELLRNVILSASTTYRQTDYVAIDARARSFALQGGARWYVSRHLRTNVIAGYRDRHGRPRPVPLDYSEIEASAGVTYAF